MSAHPFFIQLGGVAGCLIISMGMSSVLGYSSVLIPQMQLRSSTVRIHSQYEVSLVASIAALPLAFGAIMNSYLVERFGRKSALLFSQIPTPGWLLIAFSNSIHMVYIGRFLTGWSAGMCSGLSNVYIAEIASMEYRSILLALLNLCINLGILICHILGLAIGWKYTALAIFLYALLGVILMYLSLETPFWLILNGDYDKGFKNFASLRGLSVEEANIPEFEGLRKKAEQMKTIPKGFRYYMDCFRRPEFYKPLLISSMFFLLSQFMGISAITYYTMTIFQDLLGHKFRGDVAMIIVDSLRLVCSLVTVLFMQFLPRRLQALVSSSVVTVSLLSMSIYSIICNKYGYDVNYVIPLSSVIIYICFMSFGMMPLPWCMLGELFSVDKKGLGAGIATTVSFIASFLVVNTLPYMFKKLGSDGTFLTYGIVGVFGTIFLFYFLPETRNKTFAEIEESYKKKSERRPVNNELN